MCVHVYACVLSFVRPWKLAWMHVGIRLLSVEGSCNASGEGRDLSWICRFRIRLGKDILNAPETQIISSALTKCITYIYMIHIKA